MAYMANCIVFTQTLLSFNSTFKMYKLLMSHRMTVCVCVCACVGVCMHVCVCFRSRLADFFVNCMSEPRSLSGCLKENYADCLLAYSGLIGESQHANMISTCRYGRLSRSQLNSSFHLVWFVYVSQRLSPTQVETLRKFIFPWIQANCQLAFSCFLHVTKPSPHIYI